MDNAINSIFSEKDKITYLVDSPDSLYDGMKVEHDIYTASRDILLIRAGNVLDEKKIEALKRINNYEKVIHIAFETHAQMLEYKLACKVVNREETEEETGYSVIKTMADDIITDLEDIEALEHNKANEMSEELCERFDSMTQDAVMNLINALGPIDEYLPRHCIEVGMLCGLLGRWLGYPKEDVDSLVMTGLLHDFGKAAIPKQILSAPRKLVTAEFEVVKMHPVYSYDFLHNIPEKVRRAVRYHHERIDGRGYPDGLNGDAIPPEAKITAVCDIYDAMISRRAYKKEHSPFQILKQLGSSRGIDLDRNMVDVFTTNLLGELINKPVYLSNGEIGAVHENDPEDIEFPYVRTMSGIVKTDRDLYCTAMYYEEAAIPAS